VKEAIKYSPDTWDGRIMYALSKMLGFSLDTPWKELPEETRHAILYGIEGKKFKTTAPPDAKVKREDWDRHEVTFHGIARRIERHYRHYRQRGEGSSGMEAWLDKVMVEHVCPDCNGARLRASRMYFTINGKTIHDVGQLHFDELYDFLGTVKPSGRGSDAGSRC
jgi:excinuclease ABC subunit A